ncbi:hypothetical protein ABFS82_06G118000 [Erythranthe guttata]|uniref:Uncharacterized protein n=1 Tax=Erythranthe guttata TaxID=4155 RepID=A0A022QRF4_ERYGU|nr:PREDICTED: uncharacterized protein LOC105964794 [Erythranthe guttata]EYU31312.1 hypothetical protein MIMGU_mgv1a009269mg [Erythranthe guttata]|eukprot:XP_012844752.1 PREDICTED: uncharacterized protein LOC105964794 [Erythranthe guttata]
MRRSFGGSGRGMGGGSGGMMRTVQRAVRAGVVGGAPPEPFSPSTTTTNIAAANGSRKSRKGNNLNNKQPTSPNNAALSHSSSSSGNGRSAFSSLINLPASATSGAAAPTTWPGDSSSEWECVEDEERARVFYDDFVFGTAPSTDEVHHAVSALQQVISPSSYRRFPNTNLAENIGRDEVVGNGIGFERLNSSPECEMDWIEPLANDYNSNNRAVFDAFHLLNTETSVQRMVVSLSSDKALWDAVMNNEAVKDLRRSLHQDDNVVVGESSGEGSGGSNPVKDLLSWIVANAKSKMMQLIDTMAKFLSQYFELQNEEKKGDPLDEKLKTSLLLSIIVLFVVVVTRAQGA